MESVPFGFLSSFNATMDCSLIVFFISFFAVFFILSLSLSLSLSVCVCLFMFVDGGRDRGAAVDGQEVDDGGVGRRRHRRRQVDRRGPRHHDARARHGQRPHRHRPLQGKQKKKQLFSSDRGSTAPPAPPFFMDPLLRTVDPLLESSIYQLRNTSHVK